MKKLFLLVAVFITLSSLPIYSQDDGPDEPPPGSDDGPDAPPPWDDDGPDAPPAAPINDYIPFLIVAGMVIGYRKLNSKTKFMNFK